MSDQRSGWALALCLAMSGTSFAATPPQHGEHSSDWSTQPRLVKAKSFNRSMVLLEPVGIRVDAANVLPSVESDELVPSSQVRLREGLLAVRSLSPRQGGYYRVAAMQPRQDGLRMASTVVYFSNPGPAPRSMLATSALPLEIVPLALPREHRHYRANERWDFELRMDGQPLADHAVRLETAQGTQQTLRSDTQGRVRVTFPDDFPPTSADAHAGHRRSPRSEFVLSSRWQTADGRALSTAFNYHYLPDKYAGKDIWLGAGFAVLGMVVASPLLRRRATGRAA